MSEPPTFTFAPYRLVPSRRELTSSGVPLKLGSRAFDILVALIERRDRVVPKQELMTLVWPQLVVEENNLQVQMTALRKLLGHAAIATVPGRGYRFTLPVEARVDGEPHTIAADTTAARAVPSVVPTNLPLWLPPLQGRDEALPALLELLERHAWVTVVGPAGIGKTRLAQAAARLRLPALPGGVWWVDLASVSDPALVPNAAALAIGLTNEGGFDLVASIGSAVQARPALLVLDNAEHLLDGVADFLAQLRPRAGALQILLTSQEVLHAADEVIFRTEPLSLPADDALDTVRSSGAAALLVLRAQSADRHFALSALNCEAVADICRRLDGIPLAIELAAARLPLLGVDGLRARLDQRLELLTAGDRTAHRRHRTLRQALEWSHQMLSTDEQTVFRRLSVFAGGFTLAAAQAVAADEHGIDGWDALEHLGRLVDKSLVLAAGGSTPRYRMLETLRLFAMERLLEKGDADVTRTRHRSHFVEVAEAAREALQSGRPGGLPVLDLERANLQLAVAWTRDDPGGQEGLRLAEALCPYWSSRGMFRQGLEHMRSALGHPDVHQASPLRCRVEVYAANFCSLVGRQDEARRHAVLALKSARGLADDACIGFASASLGGIHERCGEWTAAVHCGDEALQLARQAGDAAGQRRALIVLSAVHDRMGRHDLALRMHEDCLQLSRGAGLVRFETEDRLNLAWMHCQRGGAEAARVHLADVIDLLPRMDSEYFGTALMRTAASWAALTHHDEAALRLFAAYATQSLRIGLDDPLEAWELQRHRQAADAVDRVTWQNAERTGRAWTYPCALAAAAALLQAEVA